MSLFRAAVVFRCGAACARRPRLRLKTLRLDRFFVAELAKSSEPRGSSEVFATSATRQESGVPWFVGSLGEFGYGFWNNA